MRISAANSSSDSGIICFPLIEKEHENGNKIQKALKTALSYYDLECTVRYGPAKRRVASGDRAQPEAQEDLAVTLLSVNKISYSNTPMIRIFSI